MADNVERIPQHKHCMICGRAFVGEGRICGEDCRSTERSKVRKKFYKYLVIEIVLVTVTIAVILLAGV